MALRYPLVLNGTTIEELQSADSLDVTSASISGDLTFTGTGARVRANLSDATIANRLLVQTSTADSVTLFGLIPSGTGVSSAIYGSTNSDPTADASYFDLRVSGVTGLVRLTADRDGAAPYYPIAFFTGGSERVRIDTSGNFNIAGLTASRALATDASKNLVSSTVTSTELGYLSGVTSAIQTQLNSKAGTADANTFTNNQIISVNSASDALRITQTGSGNALVVEDSANPDSSPFVVDTVGHVVVGTTAANSKIYDPQTTTPRDPYVQIQGTQSVNAGQAIISWSSSTSAYYGPALYLAKSASNTINTQTVVTSGTTLGSVMFSGDDGTNFVGAAAIYAYVDGTPGTNDMPGRLVFSTTADGASSPTERMRIDNQGRVGIGTTSLSGCNLRVGRNITGATISIGATIQATIQSDVTSLAYLWSTYPSTQATAFTLTDLRHYDADQGTIGAGSTVTNQFGFRANSTLTGATNNYGFYSNIASGSGRYNFYAAGTADNYFGGPVVVSTSSSSDALRITQTGAGNALVVEDSANPDSSPFVVDTAGNVVLGSSAQRFSANLLEINNAGNSNSGLGVIQWFTTNASGPAINIMKSQSGTPGTNGIVSNGAFSNIFFRFDDGANFLQAATITAAVDGTPGLNDMPGRLVFSTTADGASSPTERMRIDNAGRVGIGGGASAGDNIRLQTPATGATTTNSIFAFQEIRSDVTAAANIFRSSAYTQTTTFNLPALRHFFASPSAFGAGSTVTNQFGFFAENTLTGATNNYGFYSNIASGTGRYNFYAAGTADNYFGGPVVVSASSSSDALRITQTGAGNALVVEDSANPDSTPFVINNDGNVIVGATSIFTGLYGGTNRLLVNSANGIGSSYFANNAIGVRFDFIKSRGTTTGSHAVLFSGDDLGGVYWGGSDGTSFIPAASVRSEVDGTPGLNDMPGRLVFSTTADGASSPSERMRIDNTGQIGFSTTPAAGRAVAAGKNLTGSTISRGVTSIGQIQSDVTSTASYFATSASTIPSAFTLTTLQHYTAIQGTFGAGSTVTNQFGFEAPASLTGATNNYGFYSNIASGTGRYNFYAAGTADNYFAGNVGIGGAPVMRLTVAQPTAGPAILALCLGSTGGGAEIKVSNGFSSTSPIYSFFYNNNTGIGNPAADTVSIIINSSEKMRIASTGEATFTSSIKSNTTIAGGYTAHAAGTTAMALGSNKVVKVTPNATATFTTTVAPAGATASIIVVTSGTTSYTITFGTGFLTTGTLATGTATAKTFVVNFVSDGTTMIETSRTVAM